MDNTTHKSDALDLPPPQVESSSNVIDAGTVKEVINELTGAKAMEQPGGHGPKVTMPPNTPQAAPPAQPIMNTQAPQAVPIVPVASNAPVIADDNDLIEREWVLKAKAIVEHTKNDPHTQNHQIGLYKADYMKKRFNKDIKVTES